MFISPPSGRTAQRKPQLSKKNISNDLKFAKNCVDEQECFVDQWVDRMKLHINKKLVLQQDKDPKYSSWSTTERLKDRAAAIGRAASIDDQGGHM